MALPSTGNTEVVDSNTEVVDSNTEVVKSNTEVVKSNTGIVESGIKAAKTSLRAGSDFITTTMAPALEPLKAAGAALGNPLQTLNAPPVVMAMAAAVGTMSSMFPDKDSGSSEEKLKTDSDSSEEKLKTAGEELSESSIQLNESTEGLVALSSVLGFENIEIILEDIRDSNFGTEKAIALLLVAFAGIEKIQEWAGKIFDKIEGGGTDAAEPMGMLQSALEGKPFELMAKEMDEATEKSLTTPGVSTIEEAVDNIMTAPSPLKSDNMPNTREIREKVDPTARLRAIEEKREAALAAKKDKGKEGKGGEEKKELDDIFHPLDFLKGGILKLLGPATAFFSGIFAFFGKIKATAKVWGPKLKEFGKNLGPKLKEFGKNLGKGFKTFGKNLKIIAKNLGKFLGRIAWPITVLIGAVSAITGFIDEFKKEGDIVESVKAGLVSVIDSLIDMPINLIKDIVAWIAGALGFEEFEKTLNSFDFDFSGAFGKLLDFMDPLIAKIMTPFTAIQDFITGFQEGGLVEGMVQMIEGVVETMIDAPLNWIKDLVSGVLKFFGFEKSAKALDDLPDFDISGGVREMVENVAETLKAVFTNIWVNAKETLMTLFDKVKKLFTIEGMIQAIEGLIETMIDAPLNMIKDTASAILKFFGFDDAASDLDSIPDLDLSGKVREVVENIKAVFTNLFDKVKKLFTIEGMIEAIEGVVETMIDAPLNWIKDLVSGVLKFFGFDDAADDLDGMDLDLSGGVRGMFDDIKAVFTNLWVNAKESLTAAWENIKGFFSMENIMNLLGEGDSMFAGLITKAGTKLLGESEEETFEKMPEGMDVNKWKSMTDSERKDMIEVKEGPDEGVLSKISNWIPSMPSFSFGGDSEEKPPEGTKVDKNLKVQDPAEGVGIVAKVVEESALQASERTAAAGSAGETIVNAPSNSTQITNASTQTMIAAPRAITRGQGNIEGAGLQLS